MSRSERWVAVLALSAAAASAACAQVAGMQDVVIVDDATSTHDVKTKADGGASASGTNGASGASGTPASGTNDAGTGTLQCLPAQPTCADPFEQGNARRGLPCFDECTCAKGLWCGPQTTNDYGPGLGECCARGPCGTTCTTSCDCASGTCSNGVCK